MESGDGNEFRESEWRRLLGLLDARVVPLVSTGRTTGDVIDLDAMRKKRAAIASMRRPQSSGGEEPRRKDE